MSGLLHSLGEIQLHHASLARHCTLSVGPAYLIMLEWNQSGSALPSDGFEDFIAEHVLVSQRFKATLFGSDGLELIVLNLSMGVLSTSRANPYLEYSHLNIFCRKYYRRKQLLSSSDINGEPVVFLILPM